MEYPRFSWRLVAVIARETWRGKTLARILMNDTLKQVTVTGAILDLGSSAKKSSYHRFLRFQEPFSMTRTDFYQDGDGVVKLNLEQPFPLPMASYDTVTCFNVLEHIYEYRNVIQETFRILKPGGRFVGATPFLVSYHPDPHDFFRYTGEAVKRIGENEGFVEEKMVVLSLGAWSAGADIALYGLPRFLRLFGVCAAVGLDWLVSLVFSVQQGRFPLGYMYVFRKP